MKDEEKHFISSFILHPFFPPPLASSHLLGGHHKLSLTDLPFDSLHAKSYFLLFSCLIVEPQLCDPNIC